MCWRAGFIGQAYSSATAIPLRVTSQASVWVFARTSPTVDQESSAACHFSVSTARDRKSFSAVTYSRTGPIPRGMPLVGKISSIRVSAKAKYSGHFHESRSIRSRIASEGSTMTSSLAEVSSPTCGRVMSGAEAGAASSVPAPSASGTVWSAGLAAAASDESGASAGPDLSTATQATFGSAESAAATESAAVRSLRSGFEPASAAAPLPLELPYSAPMRRFGEVTGLDGSVSSSPAMSPPLLRSDRVCACAGLSRCAGNRLPGGGETPQPRRSDPHGAVCLGVRVRRPHQVCRAGSLPLSYSPDGWAEPGRRGGKSPGGAPSTGRYRSVSDTSELRSIRYRPMFAGQNPIATYVWLHCRQLGQPRFSAVQLAFDSAEACA